MLMRIGNLGRNWDELGRTDPLWSVLSLPEKRGGRWDVDEFMATGRAEIDDVMAWIRKLGLPTGGGTALDFGCGVGRLTQALADHYSAVVGVDVAPSMLAKARELNAKGARCRYVLNTRADLSILDDTHFDFVYSNITLQHIPPRFTRRYLAEMARVLRPGGVLVFQLPTGPGDGIRGRLSALVPISLREIVRRFSVVVGRAKMQMYWLRRHEIVALLDRAGCDLTAEMPDRSGGARWPGLRYCFVRRPMP